MVRLLQRPEQKEAAAWEAAPPTVRTPRRKVTVIAALAVGVIAGWSAFLLTSGNDLSPAAIQEARAAAMVDHFEAQWNQQARIQDLQERRAEAMVTHFEQRWQEQRRVQEIQERRAAAMVEWYEDRWEAGLIGS